MQRGETGIIEIDNALLAALSENADLPVIEIDVADIHADQLRKAVDLAKKNMEEAAAALDFMRAAHFRDEMNLLKSRIRED
jgi:excinuclease UvrABC helicase subunit UvrB